ncbi:hypothetical protein HF086_012052 [Spodoptera exigua]|uniref:Secreted protein n=1 Tax=Spodoptera exigua TaxID=7107 RepID=A0A922MIM9_SPOEX|nr:hypothetical protein HF086_012052 [Spodoptera exigua]
MRNSIIITLLSALAVCYSASVSDTEEMPKNLIYTLYDANSPNGTIVSPDDFSMKSSSVLFTWRYNVPPIRGEAHRVEMKYEGEPGDRVSSIMVGQSTTPAYMYQTPLFNSYMDVHIVSHPGQGIDTYIAIR